MHILNSTRYKPVFKTAQAPRHALIIALGIAMLSLAVSMQAAGLKLASYFGDHMVLQRNHALWVWGEGDPQANVEVAIGKQHVTATVGADGRWQARLSPFPAGGPYNLTVTSDGSVVTIHDVLFGDVWLCSGQSNMQLLVKECEAREQKATLADRPMLRLCSVGKAFEGTPQSSADIHWRVCTPEPARNFSGVGYFFACELLKDPALKNIPIGLIDSSYGGTAGEAWIPQPALEKFNPKDLHDSIFGIKPANLYNAMIAPLGPATFKGVIWYQGENNSEYPGAYPRLLSTMIAEWRQQFEDPNLPFFIVQLPDYAKQWEGFYYPWVREAQAKVVRSVPHTALVVAINTTDGFSLHPKQKLEIGRRVALQIRHDVYKENIVSRGPVFKNAKVEGSTIRVTFDTGDGGLASSSTNGIRGFAVAGADAEYRVASARIEGNSVIVQSDEVPHPKTVRYAWAGVPRSTLINQAGLPAAPFRTDDFPPSNVELQQEPISHRVDTSAYHIVINGNGMVTSLIVHGQQFISNEADMNGGTSIPSFWGPMALDEIQVLGPDLLSCTDDHNTVTLQLAFKEKAMQWRLANQGKDPIEFHIALSPLVTVADSDSKEKVLLNRGDVSFVIEGIDSVANTPDKKILVANVKAGITKSLVLNTVETNLTSTLHPEQNSK
jgi:sialate O-acetylesterase